jgi:transcription factor SPN1
MASARAAQSSTAAAASRATNERDIQDLIATGKSSAASKQESNRVRVPFSKGFQYSVRPQGRTGDVADKRMAMRANTKDTRGNLSKRMTEKGRAASKNQRSANISIEGRPAK